MDEEASRWLLQAAWRGDVAKCVALIANGVSPSVCVQGTTPLHAAARRGHHPVTLLLLEHRADTQIRDHDGLTPLEVYHKRYSWFGQSLVLLTTASFEAHRALDGRTQEERAAAACASWRARNAQRVVEFDSAREALEEQMENGEVTEGHYIERMNALRDEYNNLQSSARLEEDPELAQPV